MIETSQEFKEAVYAPIRKTSARVTFDISDVTAAEDATTIVTSEAEISRKEQMTNQKRERPAYTTFEPNYWKLDGSFVLPPKPEEIDFEVGWYSDELSGADGIFNSVQEINFSFTETHSSIGLTVTFDAPANEYAEYFDIYGYDESDSLIKNIQVRGNTEALCVVDEQLADYKHIKITILKWSNPNRRAKVTEVNFGVVRVYEDDKIIKLNLIEELNPIAETVPANEIKFVVDNSNREFNILNPNGSYAFLQQRQAAFVEIGVEISQNVFEYIGMGLYYLIDWQSDEGSLTTTFTARNRIDFLPDIEIDDETGSSTNLYSLAESILTAAGVTNYSIDTALQLITTQGAYKKTTCRKLLQMISIAGGCVMNADREDQLRLKQLISGVSVDTIDFDNIYQEPKINLEKLISRVEVNYYSDVNTIVGTYIAISEIDGGSTLKVENTLINSQIHAQFVAEWILVESQKRANYEVNWRQNPALECGDLVTIEDVYGANKESRIIRQEFDYTGYLSGKTKSKGAV